MAEENNSGTYNVSAIQRRLSNLGYYTADIDNVAGEGYEHAIKNFQEDHGLDMSGKMDDALLAKIESEHEKLGLTPRQVLSEVSVPQTGEPFRDALIAQTILHSGVREDAGDNNLGPDIGRYGGEGVAWCASFISYHFLQLQDETGAKSNQAMEQSWSSDNLMEQTHKMGALHASGKDDYTIKPGDIVASYYKYDKETGLDPDNERYLGAPGIKATGHVSVIIDIDKENGLVYMASGNDGNQVSIAVTPYDTLINSNGSLTSYSDKVSGKADRFVVDSAKVGDVTGVSAVLEHSPDVVLTAPIAPVEDYRDNERIFSPKMRCFYKRVADLYPPEENTITDIRNTNIMDNMTAVNDIKIIYNEVFNNNSATETPTVNTDNPSQEIPPATADSNVQNNMTSIPGPGM